MRTWTLRTEGLSKLSEELSMIPRMLFKKQDMNLMHQERLSSWKLSSVKAHPTAEHCHLSSWRKCPFSDILDLLWDMARRKRKVGDTAGPMAAKWVSLSFPPPPQDYPYRWRSWTWRNQEAHSLHHDLRSMVPLLLGRASKEKVLPKAGKR